MFAAFKNICLETRIDLAKVRSALSSAHAKQLPRLDISEPSVQNKRSWDIGKNGHTLRVEISTFDLPAKDLNSRRFSCSFQSHGAPEKGAFRAIRD